MQPVGEVDARERRARPLARLAAADAMQRGVVDEVLLDGNIRVERARLENDAELAERRARLTRDVMAPDGNPALARAVEASDQREQRRLAGAVQAEQDRERARRDGEADPLERTPRAIAVTDALNNERRG